jgi:hypothetical protein
VCGLDEAAIALPDAVVALRSFPRRWRNLIQRYREHDGDAIATKRPAADVWSALEYAAHVRDGFRLFDWALGEVLVHDRPEYPSIDVDEHAADYAEQDVDTVLDELAAASTALADRAAKVPSGDWGRTFTYGGTEHTAAWIVQHATHEGSHHLRDVEHGLAQLAGHEHRE